VIVEPVVVRDHLTVVPIAIADIQVAVRVAEICEIPSIPPPIEVPKNDLKVEFYSASIMHQYFTPSIFFSIELM